MFNVTRRDDLPSHHQHGSEIPLIELTDNQYTISI